MDDYVHILTENEEGTERIQFVVSSFREKEYVHIRKYYLAFDEEWYPSNQGISNVLDSTFLTNLFKGILPLISKTEALQLIEQECKC